MHTDVTSLGVVGATPIEVHVTKIDGVTNVECLSDQGAKGLMHVLRDGCTVAVTWESVCILYRYMGIGSLLYFYFTLSSTLTPLPSTLTPLCQVL